MSPPILPDAADMLGCKARAPPVEKNQATGSLRIRPYQKLDAQEHGRDMESESIECYKRWRRLELVIRKFCRLVWQTLRWLVPPLFLPTPGAWIVTTLWTFGVVLLTEKVWFPTVWWLLIGGAVYLTIIIVMWALRTCYPLRQRLVACIVVAVVGIGVWQGAQSIIDNVEAKTYIAVEFKSSPLLTAKRRKHIRRDLTSFHNYLTDIRFDIAKKVPFVLGTTVDDKHPVVGPWIFPGTPYDQTTRIPVHAITNDDAIQEAYAKFVFRNLLIQYHQSWSYLYIRSFTVFASYYTSSYRGTNRCADSYKWCHALWHIRQRYGREFTDKLLFYVFQRWQSPPDDSNFDAYFMHRFFSGMDVAVDDYDKQVPEIRAILKARGLDPDHLLH
jgi:hypothetical protein